jgi:hypothetical protein
VRSSLSHNPFFFFFFVFIFSLLFQLIAHLRKQMWASGLEDWVEQRPILADVLLLDPEAPMYLPLR